MFHRLSSLHFCYLLVDSFIAGPRKNKFKKALPYTLSPPAEITSSPSFIYFYISAKDCVGSQQWSSGDHTDGLTDFSGWQLLLLQFVAVCPLHGAARSDWKAVEALSEQTWNISYSPKVRWELATHLRVLVAEVWEWEVSCGIREDMRIQSGLEGKFNGVIQL